MSRAIVDDASLIKACNVYHGGLLVQRALLVLTVYFKHHLPAPSSWVYSYIPHCLHFLLPLSPPLPSQYYIIFSSILSYVEESITELFAHETILSYQTASASEFTIPTLPRYGVLEARTMPRPEHPPTPASSTEIRSKDGSQFFSLQTSFELPPPAVADMEFQPSGAATICKSGSSYHPASPKSPLIPASEAVKIRRRSSVAQAPPKDSFALPPPPTRSRKIIQMKPQQAEEIGPPKESPRYTAPKSTAPPKKKQPSSTSVAGRKIARKTAHSLIERRRRSKMNDEFGVLKDMIPACTGEMHKLAILQASIDYVRYLEDCVTKLQAENNRANPPSTSSSDKNEQFVLPRPVRREDDLGTPRQYTQYEADGDIEMLGSEAGTSPTYTPTPTPRPISISTSTSISTSPALLPQNPLNRQPSYSPISPASHSNPHRHYSFSTSASTSASTSTSACASTTTSPALGPSTSTYDHARPNSTLTSPALPPQRNSSLSLSLDLDMDQEATVALLMLNTDRRGTSTSADARTRIESRGGMSVKDLIC